MHQSQTRAIYGAAMVAIAPVVLAIGLAYHPYLPVLLDEAVIAVMVASDTARWAVAHLTVGLGSGLLLLAFLAIAGYLHEAGEHRWSALGMPFIVIGSVLFAFLPGLEFAPLIAAESGGDVRAAQAALEPWFQPILVTGAVTFAIGIYCLAKDIARSGVLTRGWNGAVIAALAVMTIARFVPIGAVQFYVQGAAGMVALWPIAYRMWQLPEARPVRHQAVSAT